MKKLWLIAFIFLSISCSEEEPAPTNQFNLLMDKHLKFEYYYEGSGNQETLRLKLIEGVEFNNTLYYGFYDDGSVPQPSFALHNKNGILDFNFLPLQYKNGNYYELRGTNELLILKDDVQKGDSWTETYDDFGNLSTHTFLVVAVFPSFNEFGIEYKDVYKIQETKSSTNPGTNGDLISYHYYNKLKGIIRREIPVHESGTFGAITFNRKE